jgi:hypothetical protein
LEDDGHLTVNGLTVNRTANFGSKCEITVDGHMIITGDGVTNYALEVIGDTKVNGDI